VPLQFGQQQPAVEWLQLVIVDPGLDRLLDRRARSIGAVGRITEAICRA
jgi:hypothetical protein